MNNQSGFISAEFLFAITLSFAMSILLFAITYSLSVVEITQYLVFSASRAHAAGNLDEDAQKKAARDKYNQLLNDPGLKSVYSNGWFTVSKAGELEIKGGQENFDRDYPAEGDSNREVFTGVRTKLVINLLELNLPLLGAIVPEDDSFSTRVAAMLIREPNMTECRQFFKARDNFVWELEGGRFTQFKPPASRPAIWEDNGC